MARGPNCRVERMPHDREPRWSVEWWLRAAGKWKILRKCHQWRHKFLYQHITILTVVLCVPRSSKKRYADSFIGPRVSTAIGRNVYAEDISAYFSYFLAAASSATLPRPRSWCSDERLCQSAHNCDVPDQQFSCAPRYLRHSVWAFAISSWNDDWFFGRRDARQHQSSCNHVIKLLMSGYSARGLFAEAMLTVSINQHSAATSVTGPKVQTKTKRHSHTNHLIIQSEPTWCYGKRQQPIPAMRSWSHQKLCSLISVWLWLLH